MEGLGRMQPLIESIIGYAREEVLKNTIVALLHLIEDTSNLIINYLSQRKFN